ncbi:secreted protein [Rhodopirellula maiorica SM1]|uniref:Secreted protein n=2 Tax=Novipirellula TaxID=2795426 RepID=M5RJ53_9BACT|nr:secreted protein [Rhodopirellula maiorica SM1]
MMMKHILASALLFCGISFGTLTLTGCGGTEENKQLAPVELSEQELAEERATDEGGA